MIELTKETKDKLTTFGVDTNGIKELNSFAQEGTLTHSNKSVVIKGNVKSKLTSLGMNPDIGSNVDKIAGYVGCNFYYYYPTDTLFLGCSVIEAKHRLLGVATEVFEDVR